MMPFDENEVYTEPRKNSGDIWYKALIAVAIIYFGTHFIIWILRLTEII